jgi:hypothetical protein
MPLVFATGVASLTRRGVGTAVFGGMIAATALGVFAIPLGVVTLPAASARCQRLKNCQTAATAVRHVSIAAARSVRCVWAEVRWRWTLKVL